MDLSRRSFLRNLGLTLGGLLLAGCSRRPRSEAIPTPTDDLLPTCYIAVPVTVVPDAPPTPTPTPTDAVTPTCYLPTAAPSPTPSPEARLERLRALQAQARLLDRLSAESGLDPATVARARAAIEHDAAALAPRGLAAAVHRVARLLGLHGAA